MAGLNGVGVFVIDPGVSDAELLQQLIAARLPRDALVGGAALLDGGIDVHAFSLLKN